MVNFLVMNIQIMKKINIVFAAFALIAAMAACDKEETQGLEKVRINVSVSDFDPSTRALKSGWENGDIINVYLDDVVSHTPDFTLTYGESGWTASELSSDVVSRLKESGTLKASGKVAIRLFPERAGKGGCPEPSMPILIFQIRAKPPRQVSRLLSQPNSDT